MDEKRKDVQTVRGRGRPKSSEPLIPVSFRLRPSERDRLSRIALRRGESESSYLRRLVVVYLGDS